MRGVKFDNQHTYDAWGLMLKTAPKITAPEPKTYYVDIPGANGKLDLTEALTGAVRYKNREIKLEFNRWADRKAWSALYSEILSALHGQIKQITLDDDPDCYYTGRVTVGDPEWKGKIVTLKITAEVEPYKTDAEGDVML